MMAEDSPHPQQTAAATGAAHGSPNGAADGTLYAARNGIEATIPPAADVREPFWTWPSLVALAAIAALAIGLRVYQFDVRPLWLDEAYSAFAASHDFGFLWHVVPQYETHPPLYYSMLRLWTLAFGDSITSLRGSSLVAGIAAWVATGWAGMQVSRLIGQPAVAGRRYVLTCLVIAAVSGAMVELTRDVRPYPWMILAYALAIGGLFRLVSAIRGSAAPRDWPLAAYGAAMLWLMWLHNLGILYAMALTCALALLIDWRRMTRPGLIRLLVLHAIVGLLWLPAAFILAGQAGAWIDKTWLAFHADGVAGTLLTLWLGMNTGRVVMAGALLTVFVWVACRRVAETRLFWALLILAAMPGLVSALLSWLVAPVFLLRTLTPIAVPAVLGLALAVLAVPPWSGEASAPRPSPVLAAIPLLLIAVIAIADLRQYHNLRNQPVWENWYKVVALLRDRVQPGDEIWTYPNEAALPLGRALRDKGLRYPVRPLPVPVPAIGVAGKHPTGSVATVSITRDELRAIASTDQARRIPTIWVIRQGANAYDPADDLPAVMAEQRTRIWRWYTNPIEITGYRRRDPAPDGGAGIPRPSPAALGSVTAR